METISLTTATKIPLTRGGNGIDHEEGDKSTENENEYVIHIYINVNETETNRDTLDKVIKQFSHDKYPAIVEDCINEELDDSN